MFNKGRNYFQLASVDPRYGLVIAIFASTFVHAIVYLATPKYAEEFTPVKVVRYDAALTPIEKTATPAARPRAAPVAKKSVTPTANARPAFTPKSAAHFLAPENAIAVAAVNNDDFLSPLLDNLPTIRAAETETASSEPLPPTATTPGSPPAKTTNKPTAPAFAERISIDYKLSSSIADGIATFNWTRKGDAYEIESSTQATGFLIAAIAGVLHQQSSGIITENGLRPASYMIRRGDGEAETAEFNRGNSSLVLKRSGNTRTVPLGRGMQDMQSFLFQLAYDAPKITATQDKLDVLVTNARKVYRYQFKKMGDEVVETGFGPVQTIRLLSDAPNPQDAYEVWLAPQYSYLPVKIKMFLGRFQFEQLATRIGVAGARYSAAADQPVADSQK